MKEDARNDHEIFKPSLVDGINLDEIKFRKGISWARQILLYFFDFYRWYLPLFDKANVYRIPFKAYDQFRIQDKIRFSQELYRLKRAGFIKKYYDGKNLYIELRPKGRNLLKKHLIENLEISVPNKWDRKWRMVIYDISDKKKNERDFLRRKLESLSFVKLQESVFVHPFECLNEINLIKGIYFLSPHVKYIVADRIESEVDLIKEFYDQGILNDNLLK